MQANKNTQQDSSAVSNALGSIGRTPSHLGPHLLIKGEISGNEDLKLDSKVEGLVSIGGFRLTVGPTAHVVGDIVAREAVISGEVSGNISTYDRIEIKKSASVVGDLNSGKIMIEDGAYFKGAVEIGNNNTQIGTDLDSLLNASNKVQKK